MKSLAHKILILLGFCALSGCTYVNFPPGVDAIYCHMNYNFVKKCYYPAPEAMPPVKANNSSYPYIFPRHIGTGPHQSAPAPAPAPIG